MNISDLYIFIEKYIRKYEKQDKEEG